MSGFLLIAVIVAVLASIASIGIAILLLLDVNKELFKNIKEEVFSKNIVPVNNVMEKVTLEGNDGKENCLKEIDKKIDEAKQDYKRSPSLAKEQYVKGLVEARQVVATQSTG